MSRRLVVLLVWALWALSVLAMAAVLWLDHLQRQAVGYVVPLDGSVVAVGLAAVSAATVGVVLASRRPRHPVGWLLLAFGWSVNASGLAAGYAEYGLRTYAGALPAARDAALPAAHYAGALPAARDVGALPAAGYAALPAADYVGLCFPAIVVTALALLGFVLLLTPTGSLLSPRWRWWARTTAAVPVVSLLAMILTSPQPIDQLEGSVVLMGPVVLPVGFQLAFAVANLAVVVGAASLVVRFRRARGTERQQLRWVALAAVPVALGSVVAVLASVVTLPADPP